MLEVKTLLILILLHLSQILIVSLHMSLTDLLLDSTLTMTPTLTW